MTTWVHLFLDVPADRWRDSVRFWSAVHGGSVSPARGERGQFVTLLPDQGPAWVKLQAVDGPPRVHVDLDSTDRGVAVERSLAAGGSAAWTYEDVEVHRSPGGLLVCHTVGEPREPLARNGSEVLDQVAIDIPPTAWEAELAYWAAVTGRTPSPSDQPEFVRLLDPAGGPRILLQRLDSDVPSTGAHPDFAVADRAAATRRHLDLGAQVEDERSWWTVLRAPDGLRYCLTDRDPSTGA